MLTGAAAAAPRRGGGAAFAATGLGVAATGLAVAPAVAAAALGVYAVAAALAWAALPGGHPYARFGLANTITLLRLGGAAVLMGLLVAPHMLEGAGGWFAVSGAGLLLALDGVDGWAARRQGLGSAFGARFDMETDALTILALAALALALGKAGPWVLALGAMRYVFVLAGLGAPRLARPLPDSLRRKAVCVLQVATLTLLLAPPVEPPLSAALAALALAALSWSFAVDLRWLLRAQE